MPKKYPSPRTSPTIGRSLSFSSVARRAARCPDVLEHLLLLEDLEVAQADRGRDRVAAEGVAVGEHVAAGEEGLHQPVGGDHRAERGVPGGDALRRGDHVGLVAEAGGAEHVAEAAEGADDLVGDQEHVVLVADLADPLEVARGRREAAAGVLHRLEEDRGDRVGALVLDRDRDLVGGPAAELLGGEVLGGAVLGRAVDVGVRYPEGRGDQRLELLLEQRQAGDRQRALGGAVVGDRAADHLVLHRLAGELEVVLGQLPRGLDRLAATAGEEDAVEVAGRVRRDLLGQLDRRGVGVGPQRHERQLLRPAWPRPRRGRCGRGRAGSRTGRRDRRGSACPWRRRGRHPRRGP